MDSHEIHYKYKRYKEFYLNNLLYSQKKHFMEKERNK